LPRKFEFGNFLLGADKAGSETRIARLEGIDNTYVSA